MVLNKNKSKLDKGVLTIGDVSKYIENNKITSVVGNLKLENNCQTYTVEGKNIQRWVLYYDLLNKVLEDIISKNIKVNILEVYVNDSEFCYTANKDIFPFLSGSDEKRGYTERWNKYVQLLEKSGIDCYFINSNLFSSLLSVAANKKIKKERKNK